MEAVKPLHTLATRIADEAKYFDSLPPLTDEELAQYKRNTTKRPGLSLAAIAAMPFVAGGLCHLLGV